MTNEEVCPKRRKKSERTDELYELSIWKMGKSNQPEHSVEYVNGWLAAKVRRAELKLQDDYISVFMKKASNKYR